MQFKDYYRILEIPATATPAEIRQAYRSLSMKWHPDRNPGRDTTAAMQDINEAYAILKDATKRGRYDAEYQRFKQSQQQSSATPSTPTPHADGTSTRQGHNADSHQSASYDYTVHDPHVKKDMEEANIYARDIVDEFLKQLRKDASKAARGAWNEIVPFIWVAIIFMVIGLIILAASQ